MLFVDVLPSQRHDLTEARPSEGEETDGGNCPRRCTLIAFCLAQSITQSRKLCLAQETLAPSFAVFINVPTGIRAIGPEAVLLRPIEKLGEHGQRLVRLIGLVTHPMMQAGNVCALHLTDWVATKGRQNVKHRN